MQKDLSANELDSSIWTVLSGSESLVKNSFEYNILHFLKGVESYSPQSEKDTHELADKINKFLFKVSQGKNHDEPWARRVNSAYDFVLSSIERQIIESYIKTENAYLLSLVQKISNFKFKTAHDSDYPKDAIFLNYCYQAKKPHLLTKGYLNELFSLKSFHQWLLAVNSKEIFNASISLNEICINNTQIKNIFYDYLPYIDFDFALHVCKKFNFNFIDYANQLKEELPKVHAELITNLIDKNKIQTLKYLHKHKNFNFSDKPKDRLETALYCLLLNNVPETRNPQSIQEMIDFFGEQIQLANKKGNKGYEVVRDGPYQKAAQTAENALLYFISAFVRMSKSGRFSSEVEGQYLDICVEKLSRLNIPYFTIAKILEYISEQETEIPSRTRQAFSSRFERKRLNDSLESSAPSPIPSIAKSKI